LPRSRFFAGASRAFFLRCMSCAVSVPGGMVVAVPLELLASPLKNGRPLGDGDRSALVIGGTEKIRTGGAVVFCKVVAVAQAQVKRDGQVRATGSPVHHATLGPLEERARPGAPGGAAGSRAGLGLEGAPGPGLPRCGDHRQVQAAEGGIAGRDAGQDAGHAREQGRLRHRRDGRRFRAVAVRPGPSPARAGRCSRCRTGPRAGTRPPPSRRCSTIAWRAVARPGTGLTPR